jgi:hypothetical protein
MRTDGTDSIQPTVFATDSNVARTDYQYQSYGLTKREYFAINFASKIVSRGMYENYRYDSNLSAEISRSALVLTDALISALNSPQPNEQGG